MSPRSVIHAAPVLFLAVAMACGPEVGAGATGASAHHAAPVSLTAAGGLTISSPLALDKTTVVAGDTLHGTVTWQNTTASPVSIQFAVISGRRPGGTNVGGPYDDLLPKLTTLQTIQPAATLTLTAARTFTSADPVGTWYAYATYQDASGVWHDGPNLNFTVAPVTTTGLVISSPLALDKTTVGAGDTLRGTVTWQNTSASPISIQFAVISGRRPGGTNVGGPYDDLLPKLTTLQTIQPSATLTLTPSRTFTSADPVGSWYSYATYQDASGVWHDGPNLNFTVAPVAVTVTPSAPSTTVGGALNFQASVTGTAATAVTWSVQEAGGGTVSAAGVYTAPATAGTYHVVATSVADPSKKATATVSVTTTGLVISSPLALDKTTVGAGDTLRGTVTWQNTSASPISIQFAVISGRRPGGTNVGGPYDDLLPKLTTLQTIQPSATLTLTASRTFTSADPAGSWYSYATYEDASGVWHDGPNLNFTVAPVAVAVTPSAPSTTVGSTINFQASVTGTAATAVTWSVQEASGGTVTASGVYTAPATAGTYHVVATSVADASKKATATVSVTTTGAGLVISSPLALDMTKVIAGDTLHGTVTWQNTGVSPVSIQFAVISGRRPGGTNVGGPYDDLLPKLTTLQTIQPGATLTLAAARTFTGADPVGSWYSYATYQDAGGAWHDGSNVFFTVAQPIAVAVTPSVASTQPGGTINFQVSVTGAAAGQSTAVTWSVQEAGGGTVSAAGVYTAPATAGTYHVVATSVADPSKTATATVTAAAPVISVMVSPKTASTVPNGVVSFAATVTGTITGQSTAVTWSVLEAGGGSLDSTGRYMAPAGAGTYHVVATSVADASKTDTAIVNVSTSTLIPADRMTAWNPGLNAVGGIPNRTTVCTTLSPTGGDDTAAIQSALNTCPANQVVQLNAGTFKVSGDGLAITRSNVVLRGSGPSATRITRTDALDFPVVIIGNRWASGQFFQSVNLAFDGLQGSNAITLASAPNPPLTVGEIVYLDQSTNTNITKWSSRSPPGDPSRGWFSRIDRPITQIVEVASVSGTQVTFTTPLHIDFLTAYTAQLSRYGSGSLRPATKWSGIEDLYVEKGKGGDGGGNVHLFVCAYCWVRNIESAHSRGTSLNFDGCFRSEGRDSYIHTSDNPNPGGEGYLLGMNQGSSDNLFENNVVWNANKVIVMRVTGGGNVVGYNYLDDGYGQGYPTIVEVGLNAAHMTTSHHELFEGNQSFNFDSDSVWGNSVYITAFRNHLTASRRNALGLLGNLVDISNRRAIGLTKWHYWYTFMGNVLGTQGQTLLLGQLQFVYEATPGLGSASGFANDAFIPMWKLGYDGENGAAARDPQVIATTIRHGNYDYVTNGVAWDPTNPNHALPSSLYLSSKPAFFGSNAWPWVDPTAGSQATRLQVLPAKVRFDLSH